MKKSAINFVIDSLAFTAFALLTSTGILMHFILPPGSGHSMMIWGMDRHEWGDIHFWAAFTFFLLVAVHLVLHWKWIIHVMKGKKIEYSGGRFALGILGFIVIILLALSPIISPVENIEIKKHKQEGKKSHSSEIVTPIQFFKP